jgi:hypothetical protein
MKTLLEFILQYGEFLHLNPEYRITDSKTRGLADIDASISFTSQRLRWDVVNDQGQIYFAAVPTLQGAADNWFSISLIRQYLDGGDDTGAQSPVGQAAWLSANVNRVEELFAHGHFRGQLQQPHGTPPFNFIQEVGMAHARPALDSGSTTPTRTSTSMSRGRISPRGLRQGQRKRHDGFPE